MAVRATLPSPYQPSTTPLGALFCPHFANAVVDPREHRWDAFPVVQIDRAFDRVGVSIGAPPFPLVIKVVFVQVRQSVDDGLAILGRLVHKVDSIKSVQVVAPVVGQCLGVLPRTRVKPVIEDALRRATFFEDGVEHLVKWLLVGSLLLRHGEMDGCV